MIKGEVMRLSGVSAALVALLLLSVYRSLPALLLTLVPVASGALAGSPPLRWALMPCTASPSALASR